MQEAMYVHGDSELYHFGVPGMKWGHRKARPLSDSARRLQAAKANKKAANKAYNKSFNKAYNRSIAAFSPFKKHREANDRRWDKAWSDGQKARKADKVYKAAKKQNKSLINKEYNKIQKKTSFGEKLLYNDATRKKAAKYVVNNNMSYKEASSQAKKDAWRNTAIATAVAGVTYAALIKSGKI